MELLGILVALIDGASGENLHIELDSAAHASWTLNVQSSCDPITYPQLSSLAHPYWFPCASLGG